ncbi:MAG: S9 family peptidase [Crocinitomicaceae bacterium]|nr:S9 family peptidase [Crocinitomicaceae bacterium]
MKTQLIVLSALLICSFTAISQQRMTPKQLIELNRVSAIGLTEEHNRVVYSVSKVDIASDSRSTEYFILDLGSMEKRKIDAVDAFIKDKHISPDGTHKIVIEDVKIRDVYGKDFYPDLTKSNMMIYNDLNYRHWDTWEDGKYSHVMVQNIDGSNKMDIMANEPFDCPQKPFGGAEDYIWSPDSKCVLYVTKKRYGTEYAVSTNTDIFCYNPETSQTTNLTEENKGYDTNPSFSSEGTLAWLQMKRDGYESDKNDIIIQLDDEKLNLTEHWDGTVNAYHWSNNGKKIYFTAAVLGTVQLFEIDIPKSADKYRAAKPMPRQMTEGQFDINGIVGHNKTHIIVSRRDMNHAPELYAIDLKKGSMDQLTHANDSIYANLTLGKIEKRITKATDGKDLLSWVIYPPDFDSTKTYPTLLYCQGGPQGALSQFYSYRWNFQLMAANGYIIIAPNRRGMPGYGVEWNEQISKDYGGQNMQDYLSAIDDIAKEPYVDENRLGCIGASYGGYSVFYLAAIHDNRFKTFISHDGIFNWKSMYGTTEELFFMNWDLGGAYWDKDNKAAQKSHTVFNPSERVEDWTAPIMIVQGGLDFRVPIGQGLEAFQAAQLQGIKSKLLYFPEENHWVLDYQNSLIWHTEFYKWLGETLN